MTTRINKILLMLLVGGLAHAMSFDNRFYPLIQHPYITVDDRPSHVMMDLFALTASEALAEFDKKIGIPELFGQYDQVELAKAMVAVGFPSPLRTGLRGLQLPWTIDGRIQGQGISFGYHQSILDWLSVGFTSYMLRLNSRQEFIFNNNDSSTLTPAEREEVEEVRRMMHQALGLQGPNSAQIGIGDIDAYVRFGYAWDYTLKFRRIMAGAKLGMLAPAGVRMDINNPSSIPYGGDGHWGIYGSADAEFELKEDWKVGLLLRVNKRFAKTCLHRMAAAKEPSIFGAIVGPAEVNPGITAIFSPYVSFENLRKGLGGQVQYTVTVHTKDCWVDKRADKTPPAMLTEVIDLSRWATDYVTLTLFYDFGKVKVVREFDPIIRFSWDIPVAWTATRGASKTNKVSLGVEFNF